jgi:hypothetical protein
VDVVGTTARAEAVAGEPAVDPEDGVLLPMVLDTLMQAVKDGLDPDKAKKIASDLLIEVIPSFTKVLTTGLHRGKAELLKELATDRAMLAAELEQVWGPAFATYEAVAFGAYELGADLNELRHADSEPSADESGVVKSTSADIMSLLHGRACTVTLEILSLLRAGFADGAAARQRTLHELAVVISLLTEHRHLDLVHRYADYAIVEQREDVRLYQIHATTLKHEPLSQAEVDAIETQYQEVLLRRGNAFKRPYQWAEPLFPGDRDITFTKLEAKAQLAHLRPYYRHANHWIHAGPRAAALNLHDGRYGWTIGAGARADADIAEVGHAALISLLQCTAPLVASVDEDRQNLDRIVQVNALLKMVDDAGVAFTRGARRL